MSVRPIEPRELRRRLDAGEPLVLLDVREPVEFALCRITDSRLVPLGELPSRLDDLDPEAQVVCICHHGIRSARAAALLVRAGFEHVWNLTGGIERWALEVDPTMPRY